MIVYIIGMSEQEKRYKLIRDVEEGEWESKEALLKNEESQENVIKYQDEDAKKFFGFPGVLLFFLVASIILAAVTFETFEKWYLAQSFTTIGVLVYVLFAFNVFAIRKDDVSEYLYSIRRNYSTSDFVTDNMTLDDAARMNYKWSVNDNRNLNCATCLYGNVDNHLGWCRHINLKRTGKYKMAIIGNSWTANHATLFYQECADKANSILQGAASDATFCIIQEMLVNFDDYEMARKRHAQLVKDCNGKCVIVDYATEFFNTTTGKFRFFDDKGFSYFTTPMHLSPHGIEHVRHVWTNICAKL
ncbi:unnamed protein product [Caenorhabditis brenneri]